MIILCIAIWITGFVGGVGVLLYDYRDYGRDIKMREFLADLVLTFIGWPTIIHHIIIYSFRPISNIIDFSKFNDITIVKGRNKHE